MNPSTRNLWPLDSGPASALCGEDQRLSVLAAHGIDALEDDPELSRIVEFAAQLCGAPIALVSIVEQERQRFLARTGLDANETPRPTSFCAHAMLGSDPMVVSDASQDPRFANNPLVTGHPGIRFYAGAPLISAEGAPLGSLCVIDTEPRSELTALQRQGLGVLADAVKRRIEEQRQSRASTEVLSEREERLRSIVDSVPGIAWSADSRANFDYFSERWQTITGREPPRIAADWKQFVHPEDFDRTWAGFSAGLSAMTPWEGQFRLSQADGSWRWVLSRAIPMGQDPRSARWFGTLIDVDDSHRLAESRDLLASELSHRIKNIFAVVAGLIAIRSRGRAEVTEFAREVTAAIMALGTAHDYVRPVEGRSSDKLLGLLGDLLAPYGGKDDDRIIIAGDDIKIGAQAATPLALIFHELATNSAKYGALGSPDGHVEVTVASPCKERNEVCVDWREKVPGFTPPTDSEAEGFGSRLLRMAVEGQLAGRFVRNFSDDGLDIEITFPMDQITG